MVELPDYVKWSHYLTGAFHGRYPNKKQIQQRSRRKESSSWLTDGGLWRTSIGTCSTSWQMAIEDGGFSDIMIFEWTVEREDGEAVDLSWKEVEDGEAEEARQNGGRYGKATAVSGFGDNKHDLVGMFERRSTLMQMPRGDARRCTEALGLCADYERLLALWAYC